MNWIKLTGRADLDFSNNIIHQAGLALRMNKKLITKKKKWHLLLWPLMILGSVLLIIWSPNGLLQLRQLHLEHQELIQKNHTLENENHLLYEEIGQLRSDPAAIEHLARQELGLVKDGELIFQFVSPPSEK